jgi:hypothetical protein
MVGTALCAFAHPTRYALSTTPRHPEERALARVSKDEPHALVSHPSRRRFADDGGVASDYACRDIRFHASSPAIL